MIKYVVFDLDGVLLNTEKGIINSAKYAANQMGFASLTNDKWLTFIGPPIQNSFVEHFGCSKEEAQEAATIFRKHYMNETLFEAEPYNGIYYVLDKLHEDGFQLSVATYKREDYAIKLLRYFDMVRYFCSIHGADNENCLAKADIIDLCLEEMKACKEETVLIGDTIHDIKGAARAQINFIGVTYGFGFKKKHYYNDVDGENLGFVNNPLEIISFLKEINKM